MGDVTHSGREFDGSRRGSAGGLAWRGSLRRFTARTLGQMEIAPTMPAEMYGE